MWRILNAATDAFLDLALVDDHGKPLPLEVVARDGSPLTDDAGVPLPVAATMRLTVRAALRPAGGVADPPPPGTKAYLVTHAVDTGCAG